MKDKARVERQKKQAYGKQEGFASWVIRKFK